MSLDFINCQKIDNLGNSSPVWASGLLLASEPGVVGQGAAWLVAALLRGGRGEFKPTQRAVAQFAGKRCPLVVEDGMAERQWGSRSVEIFEKIEQVGEGTYG